MSGFYGEVKSFLMFVGTQIKDIGWADIVDILILSVCLFYAYKFIKDRRAVKLAAGMAVVIALNILSNVFEMHAVRFILQNFFQVGIILLIIVFQPELRSALEKMGGKPLESLKGFGSDTKNNELTAAAIDSICEAVFDLSRDKTGALIAIERSTKLGEFIRSGEVVNAQTSPAIIKNIFFTNAPLHDGAMIIRDMRIHAAGCFLPLTTRDDIDKSLGTRHRAAIGLSEVSDAIVIVASEETGMVSVALDGELKRKYNYSMLKKELTELLLQPNTSKIKKLPINPIKKKTSGTSKEDDTKEN